MMMKYVPPAGLDRLLAAAYPKAVAQGKYIYVACPRCRERWKQREQAEVMVKEIIEAAMIEVVNRYDRGDRTYLKSDQERDECKAMANQLMRESKSLERMYARIRGFRRKKGQ
jgi:hypothetical protein